MASVMQNKKGLFCIGLALSSLVMTGCGSLPSAGPSSPKIRAEAETETKAGYYHMVPVTQEVVDVLRQQELNSSTSGLASLAGPRSAKPLNGRSSSGRLQQTSSPADQKISIGDLVAITIYTSGGGLFGSTDPTNLAGSSQTPLPPQVVDASGAITVPHVGRLSVVGRTVDEVEKEIREGLKAKAIEPWIIVTVPDRRGGDLVTVTGEVKAPGRFPVPLSGMRVLDAIASGGGSIAREHESIVTINRDGESRSELLADVYASPKKNVFLRPADTVIVSTQPWSYTTFGATGQSHHRFDSPEISLAEALAKGGGASDSRANPEAVFVYRFESRKTLDGLGRVKGSITPVGAPVIYQVNLREPKGFFMASQFAVRNKDIIYIGSAGTVGLMKVLGIVNAITAPARSSLSTAAGFETFQ